MFELMGDSMIILELVVRDGAGRVLDLEALDVAEVVELAGDAPPPERMANDPELGLDVRAWGAAHLSMEGVDRTLRQVHALRTACVAAVADAADAASGGFGERALDELMTGLLVSRRSAQHTHGQAQVLRSQPEVWAALAAGSIDLTRAVILADALLAIPEWDDEGARRPTFEDERTTLLAVGLPYARERTARRLEQYLRRQLSGLGCEDRARRRRRALVQRGVWIAHDGDGTADITARLSSEDAERVYATIRSMALADRNGDPTQGEPHCPDPAAPMDTWMAAALVDAVLGTGRALPRHRHPGAHPEPPGSGTAADAAGSDETGPAPATTQTVINVTVPIASLAGLTDEPGTINGFGVIPAQHARRLAAGDARWRHVLTCRTTGALLDVGSLSYRPPAPLARHVRLRDGTCRFPGCAVPARECDLDHLVPFPDGPTSAANLHALCRRHHGLKHEGGWRVQAVRDGGLRWTSPLGAQATTYPDDTWAAVA
jgi:hypothetical protein